MNIRRVQETKPNVSRVCALSLAKAAAGRVLRMGDTINPDPRNYLLRIMSIIFTCGEATRSMDHNRTPQKLRH